MNSSNITLATEADIPALCDLLSILFSQEAEFKPDQQAQSKGIRMIIGNPEVGARVALLEDMVVAPGARGDGAGAALLSQAITHARQQGCQRVTLLTDGDNHAAHRFYARHGFVVSGMVPLRLTC